MMNLYEASERKARKNKVFNIVSVPNVGLLQNIGLRANTKVSVRNKYGLGGPVLLRVEDAFAVAIGKDIATQIIVEEALKNGE